MDKLGDIFELNSAVTLAYDWQGSTAVFPEDEQTWEKIEHAKAQMLAGSGSEYDALFANFADLVKCTMWWASYQGQVKGAVKARCEAGSAVHMVCIKGGPISQVEQQHAQQFKQMCLRDLDILGVEGNIDIHIFDRVEEFELDLPRLLNADSMIKLSL